MSPESDPLSTAPDTAADAEGLDAPSASASRPSKVDLDLDDAPFLEEPEEEKTEESAAKPAAPAPPPKALEEAPAPGKLKALLANKKKLAIVCAALALLLIVLPLGLLFVFGGEKPPPPHTPERITVSGVPKREDAPPGPTFLYRMPSFFVERRGSEGELRFLHCAFAIPTENSALFIELGSKDIAVRDAVYYYLRNKPLTFLADQNSREMLKQDLLSVINEQVSSEKVTEFLFEEYFVTGP